MGVFQFEYTGAATPLLIQEGGPSAARAGWSLTSQVDSKATTPALRATPPVSGGELLLF